MCPHSEKAHLYRRDGQQIRVLEGAPGMPLVTAQFDHASGPATMMAFMTESIGEEPCLACVRNGYNVALRIDGKVTLYRYQEFEMKNGGDKAVEMAGPQPGTVALLDAAPGTIGMVIGTNGTIDLPRMSRWLRIIGEATDFGDLCNLLAADQQVAEIGEGIRAISPDDAFDTDALPLLVNA